MKPAVYSVLFAALCAAHVVSAASLQPPVAVQQPYTVTSPNGDRQDPYYWLRDDSRTSPTVLDYLQRENAYVEQYAKAYQPLTEKLTSEIIGRIKQDDSSVPYTKGDYSYYRRYETGKEYPIYLRKAVKEGTEQVMLDVNELAKGKSYYAVSNWQVSPDQNFIAYMEDDSGRRQYVLKVRDLRTGQDLPDVLTGLSSSIAWAKDSKTLYVVKNDPVTLLSTQVLQHKLGQDPAAAKLVYEEKDNSFYMGVGNSTDDNYVIIYSSSTVSSEMQVMDASKPGSKFTSLAARERDVKYSADHVNGRWIIQTDWQAPNYRIMTVAADKIGDRTNWQPLITHDDKVFIQGFEAFENYLAINERSDGLRRIKVMPWNAPEKAFYVASDEAAYVAGFEVNPQQNTNLLRYTYTSLTTPASVFELNMQTGEKTLLKQTEVPGGFDKNNYVTDRVWATARDGVKVPVSLLYKKDFKRDGSAPLYQYAYGSYGSSSDPRFRDTVLSLVDRGFVYAIAHIRGGQEMGRHWYEDGKLLNKINTFTDYIDVTDYLVANNYVAKDKVFGMGGSAGGLLMGAVANMAPEKYRGLVAHVPFVDVVTTMLDESIPLTTNEFDEWGNPKQKAYYDYMLSYSPYDQVAKQAYPAMLVTTGLHDSQVQYFEPAKWVAKLRTHKTDSHPLLFKTTMEAGHGGKSGRFARQAQIAEEYAFILNLLGIKS
ncbi:MAG: S9 family peptidase [Gammaproteobacteria bacterium]|nr:S9 family peptidase [Gammaproteobacteria bacterium]MBU1554528.1 S9 family peptidase [Gammaproteobacteria bacterium]MBU2071032.1 S9 family peptidase [Gammaproteobacteria bacterium]MBU2184300.1 S9 family peptidase [Gammaproteobacteria bacterium]MBU2206443.1 S9 family peptidase [Gammaproteobacteria bacterium]